MFINEKEKVRFPASPHDAWNKLPALYVIDLLFINLPVVFLSLLSSRCWLDYSTGIMIITTCLKMMNLIPNKGL